MTDQEILFFDGHAGALPLYDALEERIVDGIENVSVRVQKTQISFYNRHLFACVSFLPARRAENRPRDYITLTLGLGYRLESPRVDSACQPYPGRWTHHLLIGSAEEIDGELMGWIREAAAFAAAKKR